MRFFLILFILISTSAVAEEVISFEIGKKYWIEGTMRKTFFVFNEKSNNEQRIKLSSKKDLVEDAQYGLCLRFTRPCHLECEAEISGSPKFITPDQRPSSLIPDTKGAYAPADKTQCP